MFWWRLGCGLVLLACAGCSATNGQRTSDGGFVTLFDGTSLDGWELIIEEGHEWKPDGFYLADGTLACKGYSFHWLRYTEPLADFVLRLDFKVAEGTNSGVCLRSKKEGGAPPFTGFEVQILGDAGQPPTKHCTGAIYDIVAPTVNASRPIGEWNEMEITIDGLLVQVVLNGQNVIDTDFSKLTEPIGKFDFAYANMPEAGYLALQDHGTPIWYRNIRVKKL